MLVEILVLLAAVGGSASVVGMFGWLLHRVSVLERKLGPELEKVRAELQAIRADATLGREGAAELEERLAFLERLLEGKGAPSRLPSSGTPEPGAS